jgi:hypothetical protein
VRTHQKIDERSLALARAVVAIIDSDPDRAGLEKARSACTRWLTLEGAAQAVVEWRAILQGSWSDIRDVLLDESEEGKRLRQSSPFVGIIDRSERRAIFRRFRDHDSTTA